LSELRKKASRQEEVEYKRAAKVTLVVVLSQ
jgi:hypothetical protein